MTAAAVVEDTTAKAAPAPQKARRAGLRTSRHRGAPEALPASAESLRALRAVSDQGAPMDRPAALAALAQVYAVAADLDRLITRTSRMRRRRPLDAALEDLDAAQDAAMAACGFTVEEVVSTYLGRPVPA